MTQLNAVLVDHTVASFDAWKPHFDAHAGARAEASVVAHHLNRGDDEPNRVILFLLYKDPARAKAFFESADLRAVMQKAGVTGPPTVTFCTPVKDAAVWDRPLPAMIVKHRVANYDAWRKVYDGVAGLRAEHGIIGDAVNRSGDDGNTIVVYHQAEKRASLERFLAQPALKAAMAAGGVLEAPEVTFVTGGL